MKLRSHLWLVGALAMGSLALALGLQISQRWAPLQQARSALDEVRAMAQLADVVHELQRERGLSVALLGGATVELALVHQHLETDKARAKASAADSGGWLDLSQLSAQRQQVLQRRGSPDETHIYFTLGIARVIERYSQRARLHDGVTLRNQLLAHLHLMRAKEQLGQLRALMTRHLASGRPDPALLLDAQRRLAVFDEYTRRYLIDAGGPDAESLRRVLEGDVFRPAMATLTQSLERRPSSWQSWFAASTSAIDELRLLELGSLQRAQVTGQDAVARHERQLLIEAGVLALAWAALVAALLFSLTRLLRVMGQLVVNLRRLMGQTAADGSRAKLADVQSVEAGWAQVLDAAERLQSEATVDPLTSVFNRRGLETAFDREHARAQRHGRPLSLLILDLDHFKRVNDCHGHQAGDQVLRETCARLQATLRGADTLGRWGGEEFVVIAPESDEAAALQLAEKLRAAVANPAYETIGCVTLSIGVAQWVANDSLEALCGRADQALYAAKQAGRNRVKAYRLPPAVSPDLRLVGP